MSFYSVDKTTVVQFVSDIIPTLKSDSLLTMTILKIPLEGFFALGAIEELSDGTVVDLTQNYSLTHTSTSQQNTPDG
jgi:hypothetical protein